MILWLNHTWSGQSLLRLVPMVQTSNVEHAKLTAWKHWRTIQDIYVPHIYIDTYTHIIYIYTYIYICMYMSFLNINTVCLLLKYCCQTRKIINFEAFGPQINRNQETYLARCGTNKSKTTPTMSLGAYASHLWGDSEVTAVGFTVRFPKVESAVGSNLTG